MKVCIQIMIYNDELPVTHSIFNKSIIKGVECGEVSLPPTSNGTSPRVAILSREVGGRAAFSCPPGHGLKGPSESICNPNGEWGAPFPTCTGNNFPNSP